MNDKINIYTVTGELTPSILEDSGLVRFEPGSRIGTCIKAFNFNTPDPKNSLSSRINHVNPGDRIELQ